MSPLRFITPGQLVLCLILFFLPWIQLSCTISPDMLKNAPKEKIAEVKKETGVDITRPIGLVVQSGLQIATGNSSPASDYKNLEAAEKRKGGGGGGGGLKPDEDLTKDKQDGAPLLWLYPVALIVGIVFAVVPWASPARKFIVLGCCIGAFAVVGLQAAIGFPVDKYLKKKKEEFRKQLTAFGGGESQDVKDLDLLKVSGQFPLYLTYVFLLGAAGTSLLGNPPPRRSKKKPKRRYRDDYDDEDDDEPMSLDDDDEEEEPPPRKKKRRDRDDEDDDRRDRGKKRRRDDDDD